MHGQLKFNSYATAKQYADQNFAGMATKQDLQGMSRHAADAFVGWNVSDGHYYGWNEGNNTWDVAAYLNGITDTLQAIVKLKPSQLTDNTKHGSNTTHSGKLSTGMIILIVLFVLAALSGIGYGGYRYFKARGSHNAIKDGKHSGTNVPTGAHTQTHGRAQTGV